jgi:probable phosphoglycerate mutase
MNLYLVRHGQTQANKNGIITGQNNSQLTPRGKKQALSLAEKLKKTTLDRIYCSDLDRARQTAQIIKDKLSLNIQLTAVKELRELDYGVNSGKKKKEVRKHCRKYKQDIDYVFPEGESFQQLQNRVVRYIEELKQEKDCQRILLVSHAGVIRAVRCFYLDRNWQEELNKSVSHQTIEKFVFKDQKLVEYQQCGIQ